ncbi:phospholipid-transporting ATPase 1-like protein [Leptomonas pyrrhocoris]|uniref:Phospholipid-transporting ATPase n=1 Tax=Leptomonas pyrrhocoris TaxID=157538 RepID=A0A0N1J4G5_LEPPY|nr:phospholipid-transporting ATPase 1-like protein [Leptomonas pyrrhocoris]XP_015654792.1 phospholipid-transporting ATPase 1-like protein [Leptomonas pyrrhocoris]KPA76352.1 phospholipid-transporting ATPase 1-like protein [Leptomonas pyrrhocoris]KPA76353.1 phospholipid-transporting ATPase 1-like protein [Leptomonas pyrrhocoris]|eukprot:XP_015654791.1 phospholipid-transporting ATPase 1-like protein [Leptomonas pyrrhocoris]
MSGRQPGWRRFFPRAIFSDKLCNALCCGRLSQDEDVEAEVIVYLNDAAANAPFNYPSNFICTSKYTLWSFLPLGLLFQFTRVSNVYFLINMIFSLIPGVSPVSPATSVAPLVVVLVVALIKEGIEDIRRHQADNRANSIAATVVRGGELVPVPSKDVQAGDAVFVKNGEEVRADVVLFSSSVDEGQAFIDTCNLDGETNLKSRKALEPTWTLSSVAAIQNSTGVLHTSMPDPGLLSWNGMLELNGEELALSLDQFLYRGCVLRNTDWVWGMVAYAGVDTKMFRNLKERPPKSSNLDRKLNVLIILIFIFQNIMLFIIASLAVWWNHRHSDVVYLDYFLREHENGHLWGYRYLAYFILFSYCVPISLFITMELCKVIQAQWMRVDCHMMEYMSGRWRHCQPNTSNLNEQLAMVRFIFSDKTGTLTENVMKFKHGDALGFPIDADDLEGCKAQLSKEEASNGLGRVQEYFLALALCNTIQPFKDTDQEQSIIYEGSSPDEVALVETAALLGFRLVNRTTRAITLQLANDTQKTYNILATLEFTPDRKMMSIIVEDSDTKRITLYNKGADSFVRSQLSREPDVQAHMEQVDSSLTEMSSTGLRTLLVCAKDITRAQFERWNSRFIEAGKLLHNRSEEVDRVCLEMEKNMRIVGATAIEDKLQDEVPETLSFFLSAGVVVWMLTGDKRETAVTIATTSTLCDPRTDFVDHIDIGHLDPSVKSAIDKVGRDLEVIEQHVALRGSDQARRCTFVVDGPALNIAMEHYFDKFLDLSQKVNSAVCCRLTPIQKANVVHMFQKSYGLTALAIGDGANDVSMIQEGRVGVGIIGLEGAQAALAADYAIPRFKHLRRLCAVHGRYSLYRNASCILVSFYKNVIIAVCQFIFAFFVGFSSQTPFDGWLLTFYNVVLTSIPPFFMGIFDKDLPEEALLERPKLYSPLSHGEYFNLKLQARWFIEAVVTAIAIFFMAYPTMIDLDGSNRRYTGKMSGTLIFCGVLTVVITRFALHIRYWQWLQVLGVGLSYIFFMLLLIVYSAIPSLFGDTSFYFHAYTLWSSGKYWFYMILYLSTVLVFVLSAKVMQKHFFPTLRDVAERQYSLQNGGKM